MATALIQFVQGANTDAAGKAVFGVHGDFSKVTISNGNDTGVVSWRLYMLDAPSDSATFPPAGSPQIIAQAVDGSPTADFIPDVAGTYRVMLEVSDVSGHVDRDIRCFGIPNARGFVLPPFQGNPPPLPLIALAIISDGPRPVKPDEQNYRDNVRGWAGNGNAGQIDEFLRTYSDLPFQVVDTTPFQAGVTDAPLHVVDLPTIGGSAEFLLPDAPRSGFVVRIAALGSDENLATVMPAGGGFIGSEPTVELRGGASLMVAHQGGNTWIVLSRATTATSAELSTPQGPEDAGKLARVNTAGDNIEYVAAEDVVGGGGGTTLAPGSYIGQPLTFDGTAWLGLTLEEALKVNLIESAGEGDESHLVLHTTANNSVIELATLGTASNIILRSLGGIDIQALGEGTGFLSMSGASTFLVSSALGTTNIQCEGGGLYQQERSTTTEGVPLNGGHRFSTEGNGPLGSFVTNLLMGADGDTTATIRFLGDDGPPVPRQSITGVDLQDQIDSLVAALAALGLVADNR
jgi:hypothetical protein